MKQSIEFDHQAENFAKAIGVNMTAHELAEKLADIAARFVSERHTKVSLLSEMLHKELPYECILLLATNEVFNRIREIDDSISGSIIGTLDRMIDALKAKETKQEGGINLN